MGEYFGTDGVRGKANEKLSFDLAYRVGKAACYVLKNEKRPKFLIGMDTRISGDMLLCAVSGGIMSMGGDVCYAGVIPTPAIALLLKKYDCDFGCVISASHNPYQDNGIKFFSSKGIKLEDELEDEIEKYFFVDTPLPGSDEIGRYTTLENSNFDYVDSLLSKLPDLDLTGLNVTLDCANGATYKAAPYAFSKLGCELHISSDKPDGININNKCGSTHLGNLSKLVKENGSDIGFAFDGDGDRMLAVDENGAEIDGDMIMYALARYLKAKDELKTNCVVATSMSNLGLEKILDEMGVKLIRTDVGDKYVVHEMLSGGHTIGGEQSGHIINMNFNTTGDGIASALVLAKIIKESGEKPSQFFSKFVRYPQILVNAPVKDKTAYKRSELVNMMIKNLEKKYDGNGRVVIRPSGTENLVRVMIEGDDIVMITNDAKELAEVIEHLE